MIPQEEIRKFMNKQAHGMNGFGFGGSWERVVGKINYLFIESCWDCRLILGKMRRCGGLGMPSLPRRNGNVCFGSFELQIDGNPCIGKQSPLLTCVNAS